MTKLPLIAALFATAAATAPAMAAEKTSFTHDGVTYVYSETQAGQSRVIKGYAVNGPDFYYVVRKGQVVGKVDDANVSFAVKDAIQPRVLIQLASAL